MKNKIIYVFTVILFILFLPLFLGNTTYKQPKIYYQVYLDGNYIGTILSESELKKYINSQTDTIRENIRIYNLKLEAIETFEKLSNESNSESEYDKVIDLLSRKSELDLSNIQIENLEYYKSEKLYGLNKKDILDMREYVEKNDIYLHAHEVFVPNGIDIKKVYTYNDKIYTVQEIYRKIITEKSCTIAGYKFTIKSTADDIEDITIYTLDREVFNDAIDKFIKIFLSEEDYIAYKKNTQTEISTTGSIIENIYIGQEISYKATNIPVEEKIYTDASDLTAFFLYGSDYTERYVTVKIGDTIESIANENQISVQELLISNPQYTSKDNLIAQGSQIKIASIKPRIEAVVEKHEVFDKEVDFVVNEKFDENATQGSIKVIQEGEKGLERISQDVKIINGKIAYVKPVGKTVIKSATPRIVSLGTKYVPHVGSVVSWGWPTNSGYTITSYFGWRSAIYGLYGGTNWHSGIDISGTG